MSHKQIFRDAERHTTSAAQSREAASQSFTGHSLVIGRMTLQSLNIDRG
jgi:hypothetical protein